MVQLALNQFDESGDDYGSDDSYIPEEDHLSDSDHDSGSEIDVNDVISAPDDEAAGSVQRGRNEAVTEPVGVFLDFHVFYVSLEEKKCIPSIFSDESTGSFICLRRHIYMSHVNKVQPILSSLNFRRC
jgi:hypothetical protein